jgi:type I restriction enzyme S subunit
LPLEKVAEVRSGVAKGKKSLKDPISVPYLRVANVQDGYLNLSEVKEIEIERNKLDRYSLRCGDVLMNEGGDFDKLGRGDVWDGQIEPCLHQNHVFAVRPNSDLLDSNFLQALAASYYGKTYFLSCSKRSTNLASINSTQLREFPVLLPPLPEQKKIAQILSTWDKAIATTEKLLANSQQQKKALMQQLLTGKQRLLDKNGVRFSGEWEKHKLGDLGETYGGLNGKTKDDFGSGKSFIPYINVFKHNSINIDLFDLVVVDEDEKQSRVKKGDIFFTTSSETPDEVGMSSVLLEDVGELYLNSFCFGFRLQSFDFLKPEFARFLLRSNQVRRSISVLAQGATRYNLSKKELMKLDIKVPAITEQEAISEVLTTMEKEIFLWDAVLLQYKQEKKSLMQQLLTGKRRVKTGEAPA